MYLEKMEYLKKTKELMVQLQTFTASDYLLKIIFLIIIIYKIKRKIGQQLFHSNGLC